MVWRRYLAVGAMAAIAYLFVPGGLPQDAAYLAIGASSVAAIVLGVRLHRPQRRAPWYLMALGQLLWVIGDGVDSWHQDITHAITFPSAADAFYLSAYPVLAMGLLLLIRDRGSRRDLAGLLDSATVTAGLGLLSWVLIAGPTINTWQESFSTAAIGVAYPIADILLVGLLIRLITTPGGRTPSLRLLLGAVGLLVAGDTTSTALNLFTSGNTNLYDVIWLGSYVAWGTAALHPSMASRSAPPETVNSQFTHSRLAALTLATLIAPITLAVQEAGGARLDVWPIVVGSIVLFLLVIARMNLAIRQIVATNRARERLQADLAFQAAHDGLTRLPNRAESLRLIEAALHRAQRSGMMTGLLFIDLDGFKAVNDALGHRAGDEVLREAARRMQRNVRAGDIVARLGGDEFVVLLEPVDTQASAVQVGRRLIDKLSAPMTVAAGQEVRVGASVGVALSQDGGVDPERLLHEADTAVYRAKSAGRGRVEIFDEALRLELTAHADLEAAIRTAIRGDELVLCYQPVVDLRTGRVQGLEALVRWQRPGVGLVMPAQFIPTAEASSLICDLNSWVLGEAAAQLAIWTGSGGGAPGLTMAVKISGRHISDPRILEDVDRALRRSGIAASQLCVEITETVLTDELLAIHHLTELRKSGVVVSIDHFGTGYNSIARLQHLPIDVIKIDRSFLDHRSPSGRRLLTLLVHAAHAFGLPVIAEGVELEEQLQELKSIHCESAQGYFFAPPLTPAAAEQFLARPPIGAVAVDDGGQAG